MIYTEMTKRAMLIAYEGHHGQKDKAGLPYIFHPIHLAEQMGDEQEVIVALLHDVVEDTHISFNDLIKLGFPMGVIEALKLLTHHENDDYFTYIKGIAQNQLATKVKLADLKHNSDLSRLGVVGEKELERIHKYIKAIEMLTHS